MLHRLKKLFNSQPPLPDYRVLTHWGREDTVAYLQDLMRRYRTDHLVDVEPADFKARIDAFIALNDADMEGYQDPDKQRDLSINFRWGHNHDFGTFQLKGLMGLHHFELIALFMDEFNALPRDLTGKRVLDIGCWTGGTSLLLAAMGAEVVAIDEVKKYIDALTYMKEAFQIDNLHPRYLSLYDLDDPAYHDQFDYVLYAGVIYHVTDPVLSLRIVFNTLKDGGLCLLESHIVESNEQILSYQGPQRTFGGSIEDRTRRGWNWFFPSPPTLAQMMVDVGFESQGIAATPARNRAYLVGKRHQHVDLLRAGLSRPTIR